MKASRSNGTGKRVLHQSIDTHGCSQLTGPQHGAEEGSSPVGVHMVPDLLQQGEDPAQGGAEHVHRH